MAVSVERAPRPAGTVPATFTEAFLATVRAHGDRVALREKRLGIWHEYTWNDYLERARAFGLGLRALGIREGDRIAILSEDRPEWVFAEVGATAVGAISVGVYPTSPANEAGYVIGHSGARLIVAEDQEQVDKVLEVGTDAPDLEHIVVVDDRGVRGYDDPRLVRFAELLERGRTAHAADPAAFDRLAAERSPDEIAMIVYTSGTTGPPKGAMLSHGNVAANIATVHSNFPDLDHTARALSYLPLCHVAEKIFTLYVPVATGASANFAESVDAVPENLREVEPTYFLGVPRIWEKIAAGIDIRMRNASRIKRTAYKVFLPVGMRMAAAREAGGRPGLGLRMAYALGWLLVFRALRARLGLSRCDIPISGAAPIAPEVLRFFHALGILVREGYGQTESSGVATLTPADDVRFGSIGVPVEGSEIRIADDGEILVRGPTVFAGYYKDPENTARTVDAEGWLHTGDVGRFDEHGHLHIVDRMKDIIITAGGKNISPSEVENKVKQSPYIKEAMLIGDRRPYCVALVGIEADAVGDWATRRNIPFTTYADLSAREEVHELIGGIIKQVNATLAPVEQIKRFTLLPKELDHDAGELTATQKVRRAVIVERFGDLIEGMYAR